MLQNPTKIRVTTNVLVVERLFKLKFAIEQAITNPDWTTFSIHCMAIIVKS
jgi:hypothetical protein